MRTTKGILAAALIAPTLALTGGLAYASTTGSPATVTRPAVTTTAQAHSQHTTSQPRHDRCGWRYGDHRCDWRGHGYQVQVTMRQATHHPATRHHSTRGHHGYQGRNGYGYQGNWGYQGGYSGNHCGDDCGW